MIKDIERFNLTDEQVSLLEKYRDEVIEKNKLFNLTSITDVEEFNKKHIIDSLLILEQIKWNYDSVTDIGTGAGIPGVILAIAKPETEFVLIDSTQKKINFINEFANQNNLKNLKAIAGRAEELENIKTDLVTSRAVAALPKMLELASNFAKVNGEVILYKGRNIEDEFCPKLKKEIKELGLTYKEIINYKLDDENERSLVIYNKTKENMKGYPRLWKDIKKKDLCE